MRLCQKPEAKGNEDRTRYERVHIGYFFQRSSVTNSESLGRTTPADGTFHQILEEYQRVAQELASKFQAIDITPFIELVTIHGQFVDASDISIAVCEDPDDNKFIECAVAGQCGTIVSGDRHLLKLSGYQGITVLSPRNFLDKYL